MYEEMLVELDMKVLNYTALYISVIKVLHVYYYYSCHCRNIRHEKYSNLTILYFSDLFYDIWKPEFLEYLFIMMGKVCFVPESIINKKIDIEKAKILYHSLV